MFPPKSEPCLSGRRVLVVEDAYFIADDIASALRDVGAVVVGPARDGRTALALLASSRVDAAVLDVNLHGLTVYPVADALLARGVPFVFATGYDGAFIPAPYRNVALWQKPFDTAAMIESLPGLIGTGAGQPPRPA